MIKKLESTPVKSVLKLHGKEIAITTANEPNNQDIIDKINEIIDYINHSDKVSTEQIAKELSNAAKTKGGLY